MPTHVTSRPEDIRAGAGDMESYLPYPTVRHSGIKSKLLSTQKDVAQNYMVLVP